MVVCVVAIRGEVLWGGGVRVGFFVSRREFSGRELPRGKLFLWGSCLGENCPGRTLQGGVYLEPKYSCIKFVFYIISFFSVVHSAFVTRGNFRVCSIFVSNVATVRYSICTIMVCSVVVVRYDIISATSSSAAQAASVWRDDFKSASSPFSKELS